MWLQRFQINGKVMFKQQYTGSVVRKYFSLPKVAKLPEVE